MIRVENIWVDHNRLQKDARFRIVENDAPVFSWSVISNREGDYQRACRVTVRQENETLWDSGWVEQREQQIPCLASALPKEGRLTASVAVRGVQDESDAKEEHFFLSGLAAYTPTWIVPPEDKKESVPHFKKEFDIEKPVKRATLYVSGIGYHSLLLNGERPDESFLDPLVSDYSKRVYFVMYPEIESHLTQGRNAIAVCLGEGWRRNEGRYLENVKDRAVEMFGRPQLAVILHLEYKDGDSHIITTDESWQVGYGGIEQSNLFNGETFRASASRPSWFAVGETPDDFANAVCVEPPCKTVNTATVPPIREGKRYRPVSIVRLGEAEHLVDFGQNMAGVARFHLPKTLFEGQEIVLRFAEILETDGRISRATLRHAANEDRYIASGDERDLAVWQPLFTYHGFRYVQVSGVELLDREQIEAIAFYSDVELESSFTCGNALVNQIQTLIKQTEKANIHGILTDCPQRDERMGWMNDATVRFEETPYQFDIGALFPKVVDDLTDAQGENGAITCTAPYVYGNRPADPVSSSFLLAAKQAYLYTGNLSVIEQNFEAFCRWQDCLSTYEQDGILPYTVYGDWAAPVYACVNGEKTDNAVKNLYTPGELMSTGYYYYNARLLAEFATLLQRKEDADRYRAMAEQIRKNMLAKWWDPETARMASGSQGCQVFALWLGILPEDKREAAARVLHEDLVARDYKITTGNLCTRYLYDVLTEYGYIEDAWRLITSERYPSLGYMIQNGATTIWERFELKRNISMNSHCHPMYGAVGYWFYAYLGGIRFAGKACERAIIKPYFPEGLTTLSAVVETVKGQVSVKWMKRWGELCLFVSIPFGMTAEITFGGEKREVGSGTTALTLPIPEETYLRDPNETI